MKKKPAAGTEKQVQETNVPALPERSLSASGKSNSTEFTFAPPAFRLDDFDIERLSSYEMIHPLLLPEKTSLEDALKSEKIPTLLISGTVWKEIRYCVDKLARQELAVMLTLKRAHSVKPKWLAFDLFIPGQKASSGEVSINVDDYLLYTEMLSSHEYYKEHGLHRYLCHLHSHGPHGVFWSSTDITQQESREEMGYQDDYRFYIVVNAAGEVKADFVTYYPLFTRTSAALLITTSSQVYNAALSQERRAQLNDILINNVRGAFAASRSFDATPLKTTYRHEDGDWKWLYDGDPKGKNTATDRRECTTEPSLFPEEEEDCLSSLAPSPAAIVQTAFAAADWLKNRGVAHGLTKPSREEFKWCIEVWEDISRALRLDPERTHLNLDTAGPLAVAVFRLIGLSSAENPCDGTILYLLALFATCTATEQYDEILLNVGDDPLDILYHLGFNLPEPTLAIMENGLRYMTVFGSELPVDVLIPGAFDLFLFGAKTVALEETKFFRDTRVEVSAAVKG